VCVEVACRQVRQTMLARDKSVHAPGRSQSPAALRLKAEGSLSEQTCAASAHGTPTTGRKVYSLALCATTLMVQQGIAATKAKADRPDAWDFAPMCLLLLPH
jgi:hypothetical protein